MALREARDILHKGQTLERILEAHARWVLNVDEGGTHANLAGAKLFNANLRGAVLSLADLSRSDLHRSDLREAALSQAELSHCDFRECLLRGAKLPGAVLAHSQLHRADAREADWRDAILDGSDIIGADFRGCSLRNASLAQCRIYRSDFRGADLTNASLRECELVETRLAGARLHGSVLKSAKVLACDLRGCELHSVDFSNTRVDQALLGHTRILHCDLSRIQGLETLRHLGPTWLDPQTRALSKQLPAAFLYGAGVSHLEQPAGAGAEPGAGPAPLICAITHTPRESEFAERLRLDLMANGVRAWFLPEDADWSEVQLDRHPYDRLLLVCSKISLGSRAVLREAGRALDREAGEKTSVLLVLRIDDALYGGWQHDRKSELLHREVWDFRNWKDRDLYGSALQRLLVALTERSRGPADSV